MINIFAFFHLNIMFSSIEEEERGTIIDNCYWPLLNLIEDTGIPIGIELTGYTLEEINRIDSNWVKKLRSIYDQGKCELIGSGYAQIIGPLVPSYINAKNLLIGLNVFKNILDIQPKIGLINEQAFSKGIVDEYVDAGYEAIIMEWNNPRKYKPEWNEELQYHTQKAKGIENNINVIWNNSIAFQKVQRYIHGDLDEHDIIEFVEEQSNNEQRFFALYGSDVEVINNRPGRFETEIKPEYDEWNHLQKLFSRLGERENIKWVLPTKLLKDKSQYAHKELELSSIQEPIPVKKQNKYNILRWAVTGRDDADINRRCYAIFKKLKESDSNIELWKELCYLWSSDFRTHITDKRWENYMNRIEIIERQIKSNNNISQTEVRHYSTKDKAIRISKTRRWTVLESSRHKLVLNNRKGLAIDSLIDKEISNEPLIGTISHGYFADIRYGADYYSGSCTYQYQGGHQVTDLKKVEPIIERANNLICVSTKIKTRLGNISKNITLDTANDTIDIGLEINWGVYTRGSLRLTPITLMPNIFDEKSLFIEGCNGGVKKERYLLEDLEVDHTRNVSHLVSANCGFGLTDGSFLIGDKDKLIKLSFDNAQSAVIGQCIHLPVDGEWFTRILLCGREVDDTAKDSPINLKINVKLRTAKNDYI